MQYDIIGDIHGHADKLHALLGKLGYRNRGATWRQPGHQAVFVGDFIDIGSQGVETVETVRAMVEAADALAIMGNHELNAVAWHTPDPAKPGDFLRPRHAAIWGAKNRKQHQAFLAQVEHDPVGHARLVDWFLTLPLWLDLPDLRVVHACWHQPFMDWLSPRLQDGRYLTRELMPDATTEPEDKAEKDTPTPSVFKAVEALTKGIEIPLPGGRTFTDKYQIVRDRVRARWWDTTAGTFQDIAQMSDEDRAALPAIAVPPQARLNLDTTKPVFFGHYWMTGTARPQSASTVCVDYSAGHGGPLTAYRHEAGAPLTVDHFVQAG